MKISDFFHSLHDFFNEKRFVVVTLSVIFILYLTNLFLSDGFIGDSDSIWHYTFSHYAAKYPQLFFNSWANPVFTALSAPFAYFGFKSLQFFNVLIAILVGLFSYLVAKELKMKQPILAIILCCFTPVFTYTVFSGLTEILFAFVTVVTTYLMLKNKYLFASVVISFLPLIRSEGIFLIPIYAFFLIYRKQYRTILFMLVGPIVYTVIGGIVNHDFLWLINQNPYRTDVGLYGKGWFFQFIKRSPGYFGIPNELFYVTGLVAGVTLYLRSQREFSREFLLVILPFFTYLFVHSFMWWSGLGNSQGSNRYMAAIVPLMAIMSTRGLTLFSLMFEILFNRPWIKIAALYIGVISVVHIPFAVQNYPIGLDSYDKMVSQVADWVKTNGFDNKKVYFKDAAFLNSLGFDPFDSSKYQSLYRQKTTLNSEIKIGSTIIYDGRYFPIDGIEYDSIVQNHNFELQKVFEPDENFKVFGRDYRIAIFKRIQPDSAILNQNRMLAYGSKEEFKSLVMYDFDRNAHQPDSALLFFDNKSENKCIRVNEDNERFLTKEFDLSTISFEKPLELFLKIKVNQQDTFKMPLLFVTEVRKSDKQIFYNEIKLEHSDSLLKSWVNFDYRVKLPNDISFKGTLKTYFLNRNKGRYLVDDYQLGYCYKR
ncbi:MAG: hypothetical protein EHM93_12905 [Bacteroidales bacterium]|nr:MAG: hypothetical protein EHM93_12905 [Bacteroidales bacterium]